MLKNYLMVATRNLLRHKLYSAINLLGLAVGIACCLLVLCFVRAEWLVDHQYPKADRIYRVIRETRSEGNKPYYSNRTSGALASALKNDFPEVEQAVRVWRGDGVWVKVGNRVFSEEFSLADPEILTVFDLPMVKGDPKTVFQNPSSLIISESAARKFFGRTDPIGQAVIAEHAFLGGTYTVTGIMADLPPYGTLQMDFLTTTPTPKPWTLIPWEEWRTGEWRTVQNFVLLKEGTEPEQLARKFPDLLARYMGTEIRATNDYHLQPLTRIHLYSKQDFGFLWRGDISQLYLLLSVGGFVVLIACFNFMNLSTARYTGRVKEVGLRKVVGAQHWQLMHQFLSESTLLSFLSLAIAIGCVIVVLPTFGNFMSRSLSLSWDLKTGLVLIVFTSVVGLLAGAYPALFLSAFHPIDVLKGQRVTSKTTLRKGLVVIQFSICTVLIVCTLFISRQLQFINQKDLGFDRDHIVVLPIFGVDRGSRTNASSPLTQRYNAVKQIFLAHPNVLKASAANSMPGDGWSPERVYPEGWENEDWRIHVLPVDEDFADTYGIEIVTGRFLSGAIESDKLEAFVLNESAVKQLGWSDPVGKTFGWGKRRGKVVGVVKDFHDRSLHDKVGPVVFCMWQDKWNRLALRIRPEDIPETLPFLEKTWKQFIPDRPFFWEMLNDRLDWHYQHDWRVWRATNVFAGLAIFLACLGLFGLASFETEQRTREVGIRKVLGASVAHLVQLLSWNFLKWVLLANLIAYPVSYQLVSYWLAGFAYRIDMDIWTFFASGVLIWAVALGTTSYQVFKAAMTNPVEVLKHE